MLLAWRGCGAARNISSVATGRALSLTSSSLGGKNRYSHIGQTNGAAAINLPRCVAAGGLGLGSLFDKLSLGTSRGLASSSGGISSYPGVLSLHDLRDRPGARKKKKRTGRGPGGGLGKTCGFGHKGQKARSGNKGLGDGTFIGGQTPFHKRIPKWGFTNNKFRQTLTYVNLEKLQQWIDKGRIDPNEPITLKVMFDSFLVNKIKHGVKLLNKSRNSDEELFKLKQPVYIECTRASDGAIEGVEQAGGTLVATWFNRLGLKAHLKPNRFEHPDLIPRRARPPPKRMKYYSSYENRGYLSPEMQYKLRGSTADVAQVHANDIPAYLANNPSYMGYESEE